MIRIYDDLIPYADRSRIMSVVQNLPYRLTPAFDAGLEDQSAPLTLKAQIHPSEWAGMKLFDHIPELAQRLADYEIERCWANCSYPGEGTHRVHADQVNPGYLTLLYYPNLTWNPNHGGMTVWGEAEDNKAVPYRPGRVVLFDSTLPHTATPTSTQAAYRFTLNSVWRPK